MKKILQLFCISVFLLCTQIANAQRKDTVIFEETFENDATRALWGIVNDGVCTSSDWGFYKQAGAAAEGSDIFAGYVSSMASSGCNSFLVSPTINISKKYSDDSLMVSLYIFRTSTASSDAVNIEFYDENVQQLAGPVSIYQYNQATPSTGTGWVELVWKIPYSDLSSQNTDKVFMVFTAISDATADLYLDEIKLHHIYHETQKSVKVAYPNGGDVLQAGGNAVIAWNTVGVNNINIEYTINNGSSWNSIASNINTGLGSYLWSVPSVETTSARIRITDANNSALKDESDSNFTIAIPRSIFVESPNGGETYTAGQKVNISWTATNVTASNIEYSTDNGTTWSSVVMGVTTVLDNTYEWIVPTVETTNARIKITDANHSTITDQSNATFTIAIPKKLQLLTPNGNETFMYGTTQNITWESTKVANLNIELSVNGGIQWANVASNIDASTGKYSWVVPQALSKTAKIRITDASDNTFYDESDEYFSITQNSSVEEDMHNTAFSLYPNPAINKVSLQLAKTLSSNATITITDMAGKVVYTAEYRKGLQQLNITLPALKQGIYNVTLLTENAAATDKLFVR